MGRQGRRDPDRGGRVIDTASAERRQQGLSFGEALAAVRARASAFEGRYVDLSTASPVDPSPAGVVVGSFDAPGYPATGGTPEVREGIAHWFDEVRGVPGLVPEQVLPTIGSKEFIGLLPFFLGLGAGDTVVHPALAYPAYAAGAAAVGAASLGEDDPARWPASTRLVWLNSPRNPDGRILDVGELRAAVDRARSLGAVIVGDECYALTNEVDGVRIPSILDAAVTDGDLTGVMASYSVSKQSNLAGHRAALVGGDPELVERFRVARSRVGLIVPAPAQQALLAAITDQDAVATQRARYDERRRRTRAALEAAGFRVDSPDQGIYLWATRGEDGWETALALADVGVLVSPGGVFGPSGTRHVRFAMTVRDPDLDLAIERLAA